MSNINPAKTPPDGNIVISKNIYEGTENSSYSELLGSQEIIYLFHGQILVWE